VQNGAAANGRAVPQVGLDEWGEPAALAQHLPPRATRSVRRTPGFASKICTGGSKQSVAGDAGLALGFGRIIASEIEAPIISVNLV
jgi:hypothetical protein